MNLTKRLQGNILNREYVWIGRKKQYLAVIYYNIEEDCYWYEVTRDKRSCFNSLARGRRFIALSQAAEDAEEWIDLNCGTVAKKTQQARGNYEMLVDALIELYAKLNHDGDYPNVKEDLLDILKKVGA